MCTASFPPLTQPALVSPGLDLVSHLVGVALGVEAMGTEEAVGVKEWKESQ